MVVHNPADPIQVLNRLRTRDEIRFALKKVETIQDKVFLLIQVGPLTLFVGGTLTVTPRLYSGGYLSVRQSLKAPTVSSRWRRLQYSVTLDGLLEVLILFSLVYLNRVQDCASSGRGCYYSTIRRIN